MNRFLRILSFAAISAGLLAAFFVSGCGIDAGKRGQVYLEEGLAKVEQKDFKNAAKLLTKAVRKLPDSVSAHCNLGIAYWKLGELERAVTPLKRAADIERNDPRPLEFMGQVFMEMKKWGKASGAFALAYERSPLSARILTSRALAAFHSGKTDIAHSFLLQALDLEHDYAPALYNMGILYRDRPGHDNRAKTVEYFRKYTRIADDEGHVETAKKFLALAKSTEETPSTFIAAPHAPDRSREKPKKEPGDSTVRAVPETISDEPSKPVSAEPVTAAPDAGPEPAVPRIKDRVETPPEKVPAPQQPSPSEPLLAAARTAIKNEKFDEALVTLNQAIKKDPGNADVLWELALLYDKHLEYDDSATRIYRKFKRLFPDDPRSERESVAAPRETGTYRQPPLPMRQPSSKRKQRSQFRPSDAVPRRGSARLRPGQVLPDANRDKDAALKIWAEGLECHNARDWDGAVARYKRALQLDNTLVNASYNLGLAYKARGDLVPARDAFIRTLKTDPRMIKAHYMLGVLYRDLKDNRKAIEQLNNALRIRPDYAKAHYMLGLVYREEKRPDMAKIHFERYVKLAPDESLAMKAKKWLADTP